MKKTYKIEITIDSISVISSDYSEGTYSFNWTAKVNGKVSKGRIEADYTGYRPGPFRTKLTRGYTLPMVMEQLF